MTHALIVDDNTQNLKLFNLLLTRQGIAVTSIDDPRRLEDVFPTHEQFDIVIVDIKMPMLNGYEVREVLRRHLEDVPIIACTVHHHEIGTAKSMGFDGFIAKPLDVTKFPKQVARILKGEPVWDSA